MEQAALKQITSRQVSTRLIVIALITLSALAYGFGQGPWRQASEKELEKTIPRKAPVVNERIETELRSASGVRDSHGNSIAAAVLITAGYSAEGKYSHYFVTQVPLQIATFSLAPGEYIFGSNRANDDTLTVTFYEAATGKQIGSVDAKRDPKRNGVRAVLVNPPADGKGSIRIGRFAFDYSVSK